MRNQNDSDVLDHVKSEQESRLSGARQRHILVLYMAGIRLYGHLQAFDGPETLIVHLTPTANDLNVSTDIFEKELIQHWLNQATNEHPGTVITGATAFNPAHIDEVLTGATSADHPGEVLTGATALNTEQDDEAVTGEF